MILPYYKIEKTEDCKRFFFTHIGYFNFWDEYLIMNVGLEYKTYTVLVNRPNHKFSDPEQTEDYKIKRDVYFMNSVRERKPEEMFIDFPELNSLNLYRSEEKSDFIQKKE